MKDKNVSLKESPQDGLHKEVEPGKTGGDYDFSATIIRDYYGNVDPFYLSKKDPNYNYRFIRDEHKNISKKTSNLLLQGGAWQIVPKEHLLRIGIKERELSPDGLYRQGDTILVFIPKKLYEEKLKYKREKTQETTKQIDRLLKKGDPSASAGIHESMKGIQTKDQLHMK